MSLFITQQVGSPVEGSGSPPFNNQWVAAFNPIIFGFRREDYVFTSVADNGGKCRLVTPAPITTPDYAVGDIIPVRFNSGFDIEFLEILSIDGNGRPTVDKAFTATDIGYFNASRRIGYYIEIQVNTINGQSLRYTTDKFGLLTANISGLLTSGLDINIDFDYEFINMVTRVNRGDANGLVYPVRYREIYRGFTGAWLGEFADIKAKAVGGAFQLGTDNSEYYNDYVISDETLGKPLTLFKTLRFWKGLPFSVSYIYDELTGEIGRFRREYFLNNTLLGGINRTVDVTNANKLEYFIVDWEWYADNAPTANRFTFQLLEFDNVTPRSQKTEVSIYTPCNGYYLRWRNSLGGVDYWWFENVRNETEQVQGGGTFAPYFDNIGEARTTGEWNKKESVAKIDLQATGITQDEIEGFKDLLTSPKVEIYLDEKWFTFLIQPTAYKIFEKGNIVDIELIGYLPQKQLQTQ
jgi:hypothetical protein